jgi:hypothetical protein
MQHVHTIDDLLTTAGAMELADAVVQLQLQASAQWPPLGSRIFRTFLEQWRFIDSLVSQRIAIAFSASIDTPQWLDCALVSYGMNCSFRGAGKAKVLASVKSNHGSWKHER